MNKTAKISARFETLDGLRGVAAIVIMAFHMPEFFGSQIPEAYLAVDLFFVLSGLVIAKAYRSRLEQGLGGANFMRIRLIRFYPLYLAGSLIGLALPLIAITAGNNVTHSTLGSLCLSFWPALFLLPSALHAPLYLYPFDVPAWSLGYEVLVNILYAAWSKGLTRFRLALVMAISGASLFAFAFQDGSSTGGFLGGWHDAGVGCARVLYSFSFGLLIEDWDRSRIPRVAPWLILALLLLTLCAEPQGQFHAVFDLFSVLLLLPMLVLFGSASEPSSAWQSKIFAFMGDSSYAIYILHFPMVTFIRSVLTKLHVAETPLSGLAVLGGVTLAAAALDRIYDRPLRRWLASAVPVF
jgi:peptidoglycan/LPS O-acetylase OafA/YrhL